MRVAPLICVSLVAATVACEADQIAAPPLHRLAASAERFAADSSSDRAGLTALYLATGGPDWTSDRNWLTFDPLEDWYGVTADSLDQVRRLELPGNNMRGPLPPELGNLVGLEYLNFQGARTWNQEGWNYLTGPIPTELGNLVNLKYLNLLLTDLTGPIPAELGDLANLETLYLSYNRLTAIPAELGNLSQLRLLHLHRNRALTDIPPELGNLTRLDSLWLNNTGLTAIPPEMGNLASLKYLNLSRTALTAIPPEMGNLSSLEWLELSSPGLTALPPELGNLGSLKSLVLAHNDSLTDLPPELGNLSSLERLDLGGAGLKALPPELGNLSSLKSLVLAHNDSLRALPDELGNLLSLEYLDLYYNLSLTAIPPGLGNLARLESLRLSNTGLTVLPPELGNLKRLWSLYIEDTGLTAIPPELGNLARLTRLRLGNNSALTGPLPPELGNLARLEYLDISSATGLTGPLPPELGNLARLEHLDISATGLTGPLPPELGNLARLEHLDLSSNTGLSGPLPNTLTNLHRLQTFDAEGTGLCAPDDPAVAAWLGAVRSSRLSRCGDAVYLTQAVQSLDLPVPLVAGEEALLRVFVTARANPGGATLPPVRARFYLDGAERRVEEIPAAPHPILTHVNEGDLSASANAKVSGDLIRPGLELVIEIDPDSTLDPSLGVARRIPAEGRLAVDVREVPEFILTIIPFLWIEDPDSSLVELVQAMSADPHDHEELQMTADLLPVRAMRVIAHAPVVTSSNSGYDVLSETRAIQALEGGTGHWMGMLPFFSDVGGVAFAVGSRVSASKPSGPTIAHELGHNFNLEHAPCGGPPGVDRYFPDPSGRIGAWGYSVRKGQLVSYRSYDLMSYCGSEWISPYHFNKALADRIEYGGQAPGPTAVAPAQSLLLWGGVDPTGTPYLEPAFVVNAPPSLPDRGGDWRLEGRDTGGSALFAFPFDMPRIADAGEDARGFTFVVPAEPGWETLASVTLSGPGGTVTLDSSTDRPMSIWRDRDGQVRAILRGPPEVQGAASGAVTDGWDVLVSRGIPAPGQWR